MKKIILGLVLAIGFSATPLLSSCGGSDNSSRQDTYMEDDGPSISQFRGKWRASWNDSGSLVNLYLTINSDGSGEIRMEEFSMGVTKTLFRERADFEIEGNGLYGYFPDGQVSHFIIDGNELTTEQGDTFHRE